MRVLLGRLLLALALLPLKPLLAECHEPGVERWQIKASVQRGVDLSAPQDVPLAELLSLGDVSGVTKNDRRYQDARIADLADQNCLKEGDIISTTGYLRLVATEGNDCEYHIQISASPTDSSSVVIVEIAKDDATSIADPTLRENSTTVRNWVRTKLLNGAEPGSSGNVMRHPVFVRVTGQLFYDDAHVGDRPRGKKGMKAGSLWEIHPITALAFASPSN